MSGIEGETHCTDSKPVLSDVPESTTSASQPENKICTDEEKPLGDEPHQRKSSLPEETGNIQSADSKCINDCEENADSPENPSLSSGDHVSQDGCFNEPNSPASDTNVPVLRSRSKTKQPRYQESGSSSRESFRRKAKSEPVLITLDTEDDSEYDVVLCGKGPNRSARIKGELIRKLTGGRIAKSRTCDSSSSSDYEDYKRKKKSKARSTKSFSSISKRKKYLMDRLASTSRLKVKQHKKRIPYVYKPLQKPKPAKRVPPRLNKRRDQLWSTRTKLKKHQNTGAKRSLRPRSNKNAVKYEDQSDAPDQESEDKTYDKDSSKEGCAGNEAGIGCSKRVRNSIEADLELIKEGNVEEDSEVSKKSYHVGKAEEDSDTKAGDSVNDSGVADEKTMGDKKQVKKKVKPGDKILRKRGRPRLSETRFSQDTSSISCDSVPFLQSSYCFNVAPKLPKCRECNLAVKRTTRSLLNSYCRFMEYRKLCYSKNGSILNAGFSEPTEATLEHLSQWLPDTEDPPKDLDCNTAKSLLEHIGDQFCDLVEQEREALSLHIGRDKVVTWKRIVQGVREMCDVCYTTLFNLHWVCPICGLAVCIDCYKGRKQGIVVEYDEDQPKNRDQFNWLWCTQRQPHDPERLVLAQIIPGNALWIMRDLLHKVRKEFEIPSYCKCNPQEEALSDKYPPTGICKQLMSCVTKSFSLDRSGLYFNGDVHHHSSDNTYDDLDIEVTGAALKWLESTINSNNVEQMRHANDYINSYEDFTTLSGNMISGLAEDADVEAEREFPNFSLDDIIGCVVGMPVSGENKENSGRTAAKHFSKRYPKPNSGRDPLPIRIYTKLESSLAFPDIPHSWFCNGRLLFLHKADHSKNLALFQELWKRGQPILVNGVDEQLNMDLWHPDAFCRDFGEEKNDLVDCKTGVVLKNLPMKKFWEGFECFDKRITDENGEYLLLKLKDWPPGEDFSEMLPERFDDLMAALPLPEYTRRDGVLNLAGRLPSWFVRPDLGPKMYNAYGSALFPTKGTTNLHLDISDAVNVMVYVGIPADGNAQLHIEEALKAIDEGGCDSLMRARVRARGAKPGALWHIYNARDADKIRDLLTKVAIERGEKLEAHHDPIHDQSWYLDEELRKRLDRDYGVEGYAIAQCLGDAVFIPAGAPHQVRNLHSCVKVAEDFVSPENIAHCFKLTQEFRNLSDTHTNHEDKLQIKNIIYHVVRDALSHLLPP